MSVEQLVKEYDKKLVAFLNDEITMKEWTDYCQITLAKLIHLNSEILKRLRG